MDENSDTLRILVASDCHLGFMEKDEIRRHDSFNSFDEICSIASQRQVDFLLLGGDLFHENKPSRTTLIKTIEILRNYCLSDRPVKFQVVSDQTINFSNRFGHVNYEDPHYNVGLPVFTIHGNHDDPAGVDNLSAIDILASCNLVNYFGKVVLGGSGVGQIALHPILLRKGGTKVALYGLGNIRDERLNRMFQTPHAVQWIRPASQDDCLVSDWFNIFVLHQNRVKANPKNAINEHFLARFLDFIVWGHEHECLVDPQEVPGMEFHVTQPGSSVATSLTEGESAPKHVLLLEIKGSQYRPTKIPLQSVRPFAFGDVSLKDNSELNANDQTAVMEYLRQKVQEMIDQAANKSVNQHEPVVPLIRLRVDYTGFTTINPQRFGQKFVGKVANPNDILLFMKAAKARQTKLGKGDDAESLRPEELNQQNIEALVAESNLKMEILPVNDLGLALHAFVNKDDKQAFHTCVQHNLDETQSKLAQEGEEELEEKDVAEKVSLHMQLREASRFSSIGGGPSAVSTEQGQASRAQSHFTESEGMKGFVAGKGVMQDFSDDEENPAPVSTGPGMASKRSGRAVGRNVERGRVDRARGRGSGGGRYKQTTLNIMGKGRTSRRTTLDESDAEDPTPGESKEGSEENLDEEESEPEAKSSRGRKRAAPQKRRGTAKTKGLVAKRGRKGASAVATSFADDDDMDNDDDDDNSNKASSARDTSGSKPGLRSWGALRR